MENKVYLNTEEDLTKALSEGKTVFIKYTGQGDYINDNSQLKIVNGIIVQKLENGSIYLNPADFSLKVYKFYLKEKPALKIEVGKFYKTRGSKKALCLYIDNCRKGDSHIFKMYCIGKARHYWVDSKGNRVFGFYSDLDIVDYWEDEVK